MTFIKVSLETRNFVFEAFGLDKYEAFAALEQGFKTHAKQYKLPFTWVDEFREDIKIQSLKLGGSYRDGVPL
jgi:hypothetical protein